MLRTLWAGNTSIKKLVLFVSWNWKSQYDVKGSARILKRAVLTRSDKNEEGWQKQDLKEQISLIATKSYNMHFAMGAYRMVWIDYDHHHDY